MGACYFMASKRKINLDSLSKSGLRVSVEWKLLLLNADPMEVNGVYIHPPKAFTEERFRARTSTTSRACAPDFVSNQLTWSGAEGGHCSLIHITSTGSQYPPLRSKTLLSLFLWVVAKNIGNLGVIVWKLVWLALHCKMYPPIPHLLPSFIAVPSIATTRLSEPRWPFLPTSFHWC
jgi:hypothetical protein